MQKIDIIVTQHQPLVRYLIELGIATKDTPVIAHASIGDIKGKHVAGVLPVAMAAHTASYTEVPLSLTPADRLALRQGDLSYERMVEIADTPTTFQVFGGSDSDRGYKIACASEKYRFWTKADMEASVYHRLARLVSGRMLYGGRRMTTAREILIATAMGFGGQNQESGPVLHADGKLRKGWSADAEEVTSGIVSWSGDGGHAAVEVDLDKLRLRAYGSGPDWTEWLDLADMLPEQRWRLQGRNGFEVSEQLAKMEFVDEVQAWEAAEIMFGRLQEAGGPFGVQAIVGPVPV